jgi:Domain of unknown function (DUF222)/HNH endonuclease
MSASFSKMKADLRSFLATADPERTSIADAVSVVTDMVDMERMVVAIKTLYATRMAQSSVWKDAGHRSAAHWLAEKSGTDLGQATGTFETAEALGSLPLTVDALRAGRLSSQQARQITAVAAQHPCTEKALIETAAQSTVKGLKDQCRRILAQHDSEAEALARHERIRQNRFLRWWTDPEGAFCLNARTTAEDGAKVLAALETRSNALFHAARRSGIHQTTDAYRVDALVELVTGEGGPKASQTTTVFMHVAGAALVRGKLEGQETCEIAGLGPVPLAAVHQVLPSAYVKILVEEGVDVTTVAHAGRAISAHLLSALESRDRICVVEGCDVAHGLEAHHIIPFAQGGKGSLENLVRVCSYHHYLITHRGFEITGPPGHWTWITPEGLDRNGERILTDEVVEALAKEADERRALFDR